MKNRGNKKERIIKKRENKKESNMKKRENKKESTFKKRERGVKKRKKYGNKMQYRLWVK